MWVTVLPDKQMTYRYQYLAERLTPEANIAADNSPRMLWH